MIQPDERPAFKHSSLELHERCYVPPYPNLEELVEKLGGSCSIALEDMKSACLKMEN